MGSVFFTTTTVEERAIICTYNGNCNGNIIRERVQAESVSRSLYTRVIPDGDHFVMVDVRDRTTGKSKSVEGNAADAINSAGWKNILECHF